MEQLGFFGAAVHRALPAVLFTLAMPALALAAGDTPAPAKPPAATAAPAPAATPPPAAAAAAGETQWVKLCNTDPATKKELCLVIQELRADTGQFIASVTVRQFTGEDKISLIAAVPLGMLIQPGIHLQVDTGKATEIKFGICFQNACYGELPIDATFLATLRGGKQLVVTTLTQQAKTVNFPLSLAGFSKVYDSKGLDAAAAKAHEDELNKALQARADEARKKLIDQQQKESGGGTAN